MRPATNAILVAMMAALGPTSALAQEPVKEVTQTVPRLMQISGTFQPADGQPPASVEAVTLSVYAGETDGAPLW